MLIDEKHFLQIFPKAVPKARSLVPALNAAMEKFGIVTPLRISAFVAQVGHESLYFTRLVENLNYSVEGLMHTWPSRFDVESAARMAHKPELIANRAYFGRMGNAAPGDGWKYRGRGLIQITGKNNYSACGISLGLDLINMPEALEQPDYAAMSAAWFWSRSGLNVLADAGDIRNIGSVINTGGKGRPPQGAAERMALYIVATKVMG